MRVENIRTLPADSAWIEKSKAGSAATAKALPSKNNKEAQEPQRLLQNYSRSADEIQQDKVIPKSMNRSIRFIIDDQSNDIVVGSGREYGEVIMEIPLEEVLNLERTAERMSGCLWKAVERNAQRPEILWGLDALFQRAKGKLWHRRQFQGFHQGLTETMISQSR